jgi:cell division protein FtsI (penicillin-binding protein 3)
LVMQAQRGDGDPEKPAPQHGTRILTPETAVMMRQMMEGVVLDGTGRRAVLQGYTSAGKTGSAQIYDPVKREYTHTYNASFLGFAPVTNPRVVIAVTLHGTGGGNSGFGGVRAAPVFREVAMSALRMFDVPKDLPDQVAHATGKVESDLSAAGSNDARVIADAVALAAVDESSPKFSPEFVSDDDAAMNRGTDVGRNQVVSSVTRPLVREGTSVQTNAPATSQRPFFTEVAVGAATTAVTPNFLGKTSRSVIQESTASGIPVDVYGSGMAVRQDPAPGAPLRAGAVVKVQFGR